LMSKLLLNIVVPLLCLCIAPVVAIIHLTVGHAILHYANPHSLFWSPRLLSTASAGAIGGTILGVFLVPLFISLFNRRFQLALQADDHVDAEPPNSFAAFTQWAACVAIVFAGAPAAGALGVVCLRGSVGDGKVLSPGAAAVAGVVGGAVVLGCVLGSLIFVVVAVVVSFNYQFYRVSRETEIFLT
ncbi:hypothetical protein H0H81_011868, partial [Sphagnurus paluster]